MTGQVGDEENGWKYQLFPKIKSTKIPVSKSLAPSVACFMCFISLKYHHKVPCTSCQFTSTQQNKKAHLAISQLLLSKVQSCSTQSVIFKTRRTQLVFQSAVSTLWLWTRLRSTFSPALPGELSFQARGGPASLTLQVSKPLSWAGLQQLPAQRLCARRAEGGARNVLSHN